MIKILCIEPRQLTPVGYWRVFKPFEEMRRLFPGVFEIEYKSEKLDYADISGADVIFMTRPHKMESFEWIREAKMTKGIVFVMDMDDDLLDMPREHPLFADFKKRRKIIENHMKIADFLWYSTEYLMKKYGKGIHVPNAVDVSLLPEKPAPDHKKIMWRGSSIQMHDLLHGASEFDKIQSHATHFGFIGFLPPFYSPFKLPVYDLQESLEHPIGNPPDGARIVNYPIIDNTSAYLKQLQIDQWNYVWKPLMDHGFNEAKSNIAWIEATISGGVCLTNFSGRPQWEYTTADILSYDGACELWADSRQVIRNDYDLSVMAQRRAVSIIQALKLEHLFAAQ
jgi:hypothetical protein